MAAHYLEEASDCRPEGVQAISLRRSEIGQHKVGKAAQFKVVRWRRLDILVNALLMKVKEKEGVNISHQPEL